MFLIVNHNSHWSWCRLVHIKESCPYSFALLACFVCSAFCSDFFSDNSGFGPTSSSSLSLSLSLSLSYSKSQTPFLSFPFLLPYFFFSAFSLKFFIISRWLGLLGHRSVSVASQVVCFLRGFCNSWAFRTWVGIGIWIGIGISSAAEIWFPGSFFSFWDGKCFSLCVKNLRVVIGLSLSFELLCFWIFDFELSLAKDLLY